MTRTLDVMTYVLQANDFPVGTAELTPEATEDILVMRKMVPGEPPREAQNFSVVQVVGCLTQGPDNMWVLTNTSEPILTGNRPSSPEELKAALARPLGNRTFRLVSVAQFAPESHKGQKVEAKGLMYRAPNKDRLNLSSLQMVASTAPALQPWAPRWSTAAKLRTRLGRLLPPRPETMSTSRWFCAGLLVVIVSNGAPPALAAAQISPAIEGGKKLFEGLCAVCHGSEGGGGEAPSLNRFTLDRAPDDAALRALIKNGIQNRMPHMRHLSDDQLQQLGDYVRSLGRTRVGPA